MKKQVPAGIKILAIIYYINAALSFLLALYIIFGSWMIVQSVLHQIPVPFGDDTSGSPAIFIIIGAILFAYALLSLFIGRGLWKGQNWARVLITIFLVLGGLSYLITILMGVWIYGIHLIIVAFLLRYLLFNKKVKKAFS